MQRLIDTNNLTGYAQVVEEYQTTSAGTTATTYTYGSSLISQTSSTGYSLPATHYFGYDGLGSVRQLTDAAGTVTDTWDYDAFGNTVARTGTTDNAYLYRGEQYDADLGMYYLRARFYNQSTGRFWNQDGYEGSSGDPASLHKYLYANADPVMRFDPSGRMTLNDVMVTLVDIGLTAAMAIPRAIGIAPAVAGTIAVTTLAAMNMAMFAYDQEFRDMTLSMPDGMGMVAADAEVVAGAARELWGIAREVRSALPFIRMAARSAGEGTQGYFTKFLSKNGGDVWTSNGLIDQDSFGAFVVTAEGDVTILTGAHGDPRTGALTSNLKFLNEDLKEFGMMGNVTILDVSSMNYTQIYKQIMDNPNVFCAWCYSERHPAVMKAIAGGLK